MLKKLIRKFCGFLISMLIFSFCLLFAGGLYADDLSTLIHKSQSKDPAIRIGAARALGELRDPGAVGPLIIMLRGDKNWDVRASAEDAARHSPGHTCPGQLGRGSV